MISCFLLLAAAAVIFTGCGKKDQAAGNALQNSQGPSETPTSNSAMVAGRQPTVFAPTPVLQPILTAWQEGHSTDAVDLFLHANWNARPLFPSGMAVGLTDAQFKALPESDRQLRSNEMLAQLNLMKQLATAVNTAADQALSIGDQARARQCCESLNEFGAALDDPNSRQLVRMVGQVSQRMAEQGLARIKG